MRQPIIESGKVKTSFMAQMYIVADLSKKNGEYYYIQNS